ncbi:MAG TPA: response regulator [Vicinamibacteria bacterium]|nr:response regulator [Vicinamibacteria bacterium]
MPDSAEILVVEDDADDLELTLRVFRKHRLADRVAVVRDGAAAIQYLASQPKPRVVLLDLKLPRLSGVEVLKRMRTDERTRHIPVVVLTSSSELVDLDECYRNGTNSYVVKPVESSEFEAAVYRLSAYWLELNRTPSS